MTRVMARVLGAILVAVVAIAATGGVAAFGFWSSALPAYLSVIIASVGLGVALLPVLPMIPIGRVLRRAMPSTGRRIDHALRVTVALIPGTFYFLAEESLVVDRARLPSDDAGLGAVMVMAMVALAYACLHLLTGRMAPLAPRPAPRPTSGPTPWITTPPEPAEEFWSPEAIVGWRVWAWTGKVLKGSFEHEWPTQSMEADCVVCADPPGWDCPCGIYAMKDRWMVPPPRPGSAILGKVEMSGRVVEHEEGYRASQARMTELWVEDPETARRVAQAYPEVSVRLGSPPEESPTSGAVRR